MRGLGLMAAMELVADRGTRRPFEVARRVAWQVGDAALERGLVTYPLQGCIDGVEGDMVKLTPPLCITAEQVDDLAAILDAALDAVEAGL